VGDYLPSVKLRFDPCIDYLEVIAVPKGGGSEMYGTYYEMLYAADGKQGNLIMVSSSVKGEGKTFTSLNLAMSIAMDLDSTVLLVDADVAEPGLSKALGVKDKPGLIEHLDDQQRDLSRLLLRTDIPNLTILPAGRRHKRSTELLAGRAMKRLVHELANRYPNRIVLFDSPSLLQTSEASVLASLMGQVLIVVEYEMTSQVIVKEALSQFENVDNVYLILNKCKENIFSGRYGYGSSGES
jgi:exopolysaccharide/PEP-CTERM locus tyrosine autokinase